MYGPCGAHWVVIFWPFYTRPISGAQIWRYRTRGLLCFWTAAEPVERFATSPERLTVTMRVRLSLSFRHCFDYLINVIEKIVEKPEPKKPDKYMYILTQNGGGGGGDEDSAARSLRVPEKQSRGPSKCILFRTVTHPTNGYEDYLKKKKFEEKKTNQRETV